MSTPPPFAEGVIIANRFRLVRVLGKGGMGSVWAAWHTTLGVEVAVKFIDAQFGRSPEIWSRFGQEAMAAAKIKSPHVVSILDFGTDEHARPYIAMEILHGEELASRLDREGTLPVPLVAQIVAQACKGLARAHASGVVHRDIKPDNLFLCDDDDGFLLKILDFGIAKVTQGGSTHLTGTGQVLGTPLYMSPEQAYGNRPVDHRTDLYSLAVVAYRCLTGRVPFESDGVGEIIVAVTTHEAKAPTALRPELPPGLDEFFRRAMAKSPDERFTSARKMAEAFVAACELGGAGDTLAQRAAFGFDELSAVYSMSRGGSFLTEVPPPASSQRLVAAPIAGVAPVSAASFAVTPLPAGVMPPATSRAWQLADAAAGDDEIEPALSQPSRTRKVIAALVLIAAIGCVGLYAIGEVASLDRLPASAASGSAVGVPTATPPAPATEASAPVIAVSALPTESAKKPLRPAPRSSAPARPPANGTAPVRPAPNTHRTPTDYGL